MFVKPKELELSETVFVLLVQMPTKGRGFDLRDGTVGHVPRRCGSFTHTCGLEGLTSCKDGQYLPVCEWRLFFADETKGLGTAQVLSR